MLQLAKIIMLALVGTAIAEGEVQATTPRALVYRGPSACKGCPEAVQRLLQSSKFGFNVTFCGPTEDNKLTPELLAQAAVYAFPGGPDLNVTYKEMKSFGPMIRHYVKNGGRYIGFCLGAYLAGSTPGLYLLPRHVKSGSEIERKNAQVKHENDTVIQVDWTFTTGPKKGQAEKGRWVYFQEGAVVTGLPNDSPFIIGKYSANGDVAATVTPYGKGWVGLTGPHPEASQSWYDEAHITNPNGIQFDIGYDLVEATMQGIHPK